MGVHQIFLKKCILCWLVLEPGETIEAAVRREVLEETNVEVGLVTYLASQPGHFQIH